MAEAEVVSGHSGSSSVCVEEQTVPVAHQQGSGELMQLGVFALQLHQRTELFVLYRARFNVLGRALPKP